MCDSSQKEYCNFIWRVDNSAKFAWSGQEKKAKEKKNKL